MPHHQHNSPGDVFGRLRRWTGQGVSARRNSWRVPVEPPEGSTDLGADRPLTTVDRTIRPTGSGRYVRLTWAEGEPYVVRTDLGAEAGEDREANRRSLL